MRAMWKGHVRFGLVTIATQLYKAEETSQQISFNQLHREDFGRVGYRKYCKRCDRTLDADEIVKGYEFEDDRYVVVEDEELDGLKIPSTRIIEVQGFLEAKQISPILYDRSYFLGPNGAVAAKPYALFRQALRETGKTAVGRVVLSRREHVVTIHPCAEGLVLYTVNDPEDIRDVETIAGEGGEADVDQKLLQQSKQIIDTMALSLAEIDFTDHYQEALRRLIEAKVHGEEVVTVEDQDVVDVQDIGTALQETIKQLAASRERTRKAQGRKAESKSDRAAARKERKSA